MSNIFYVFRSLLPGNKDDTKERERLGAGGLFGYVNIETDGPSHIYMCGASYAHFNP